MPGRLYDDIAQGLDEALAIARGEADPSTYRVHHPAAAVDVRAIRKRLKLTQAEFAARFRLSHARVRDWEQGRSRPDPAVCAYLTVIDRNPEAVTAALAA